MGKDYRSRRKEVYSLLTEEVARGFLEVISERDFIDWFYVPNEALENKTPLDVARTEDGLKQLEKICYRLRSGEPI